MSAWILHELVYLIAMYAYQYFLDVSITLSQSSCKSHIGLADLIVVFNYHVFCEHVRFCNADTALVLDEVALAHEVV